VIDGRHTALTLQRVQERERLIIGREAQREARMAIDLTHERLTKSGHRNQNLMLGCQVDESMSLWTFSRTNLADSVQIVLIDSMSAEALTKAGLRQSRTNSLMASQQFSVKR